MGYNLFVPLCHGHGARTQPSRWKNGNRNQLHSWFWHRSSSSVPGRFASTLAATMDTEAWCHAVHGLTIISLPCSPVVLNSIDVCSRQYVCDHKSHACMLWTECVKFVTVMTSKPFCICCSMRLLLGIIPSVPIEQPPYEVEVRQMVKQSNEKVYGCHRVLLLGSRILIGCQWRRHRQEEIIKTTLIGLVNGFWIYITLIINLFMI